MRFGGLPFLSLLCLLPILVLLQINKLIPLWIGLLAEDDLERAQLILGL
jgi:hypothetical protein